MGKRGPQPKPQEIKRLEGNPGKRRTNNSAPEPEGVPTCPAHLGSYGKAVWKRIAKSMPPKLYKAADRELLAAYCQAADLHKRAVEAIRTEGEVSFGESGAPYQNPWVSIQNKQAQLLASLGSRLGLDPAARSSINMPEEDEAPSKFGGLVAIEGGRNAS
jgi:P27 family predicted phage terminase small subunit